MGRAVAGHPPQHRVSGRPPAGSQRLCFCSLSTFARCFFTLVLVSQIWCHIPAMLLRGVLLGVSLLMTETTLAERDVSQGIGKLREHHGEPGTRPGTPHPHRTASQQPCLCTPEEAHLYPGRHPRAVELG